MKCASVGKALPLFIGRDLDAASMREISAHLATCGGCRMAETSLRRSREWLESAPPPPMDESDFAAIRRGVRRRIEANGDAGPRDRRRAGGLALAGVLAAALLAVVFFLRPASEIPRPAAAGHSPVAVLAAPPSSSRAAENLPAPAPRRAIRQVSRARIRLPAPAARPGIVKIEFQTANPDVRIIWLVKGGDAVPSAAAGRNQEVS